MNDKPIKILQYGEGNFLRAFVDYMVDIANKQEVFDGAVAIVKPIPYGTLDAFKRQNNQYHVCLRGRLNEQDVDERQMITCVQKAVDPYIDFHEYLSLAELPSLSFVVSNTTEAGIAFDPACRLTDTPPTSFPGKLTQFLLHRYRHFNGNPQTGLIMLPAELIEDNGKILRDCVMRYITLWKLDDRFRSWVENACCFCSTLVDRIVTGYPSENAEELQSSLAWRDELLDVAEPFGLWVIESEQDISARLPLDRAGQPVIFTDDQRPYRERKVRILNGAHTSTVLAGYLCGYEVVGACMTDPLTRGFMEKAVMDEIIPSVPMPRSESESFARSVFERFENPFIRHECLSISLNSVSKWKTRILPSLKDYYHLFGVWPKRLAFSLAALLVFYTASEEGDGCLIGFRNGVRYPIRDNHEVLRFFQENSMLEPMAYTASALAQLHFWGEDLNLLPGLTALVGNYVGIVRMQGMRDAMQALEGANHE